MIIKTCLWVTPLEVEYLGGPGSVCEIPVGFHEVQMGLVLRLVVVTVVCGSLSYHIAFMCFVSDSKNVTKDGILKVMGEANAQVPLGFHTLWVPDAMNTFQNPSLSSSIILENHVLSLTLSNVKTCYSVLIA